jgi:hypothetical protein
VEFEYAYVGRYVTVKIQEIIALARSAKDSPVVQEGII